MTRMLRGVALLLALVALGTGAANARTLRVGSVPWQSPAALRTLYDPTLRLLERKLGMKVEFYVSTDIAELEQRVAAASLDIAVFGAASYVLARQRQPGLRYLATCMIPDDHFYTLVFTRSDSALSSLADVRGRALGLSDRQSTSGYVMPHAMLARLGIDAEHEARVYLLGQHTRVLEAVASGAVEVGAVASTAWDAGLLRHGPIFRVLAKSPPMPRDPVAAAPHVDKAFAARLQKILGEAQRDPEFARENGELKGYSVHSDKFYDPIRKLVH